MREIPAPSLPEGHPDRLLHCEELLEDAFLELARREADQPAFLDLASHAITVGWNAGEVARALKSLRANYVLACQANAETDLQITKARKAWEH